MRNENFTKLTQFKKFLIRLENQIKSRKFFTLSGAKKRELVQRLRRLQRQLSTLVPTFRFSKLFAAASFLLGVATQQGANAQTFLPPVVNPFSLTDIGTYESKPEFADIDADGDLDMFSGSAYGDFFFYENIGTDSVPNFDTSQVNSFGLVRPTSSSYYMELTSSDIDSDGDLDILASDDSGDFFFFENRGTDSVPLFDTLVTNPWGLPGSSGFEQKLDWADLDGDGDYDLLVGHAEYNEIYFFENRGTDTVPLYDTLMINPFGLTSLPYGYPSPTTGDLDKDGDLDLLIGVNSGDFYYFQNIGSDTVPLFDTAAVNPFGLVNLGSYVGPVFVDLDADGDLDIMSGEANGDFFYFEQTDSVITRRTLFVEEPQAKLYPNPTRSHFKIEIGNTQSLENASLSVLNSLGQEVYFRSIPENTQNWSHEIDASGWNKGIYFVRISNERVQSVQKLMVE